MTLEEKLNSYENRADMAVPLMWRTVRAGLWIADSESEFIGMIEQRGHANFEVLDRLGRTTGFFSTLDEAKASL